MSGRFRMTHFINCSLHMHSRKLFANQIATRCQDHHSENVFNSEKTLRGIYLGMVRFYRVLRELSRHEGLIGYHKCDVALPI